ncbi:hypothetical protein FOMA001_g20318 [Fusarium oxysporum f. sp. matthiolae]|nr:hypothetical protein FOMA001_g20318 [Fusarium oxysporum f. sp. matthiolae]
MESDRRTLAVRACVACRKQKRKCTREVPECFLCSKNGRPCEYAVGSRGKYLEDCQIAGPWDPETGEMGSGYAPWVYNEDKAVKLWERSVELVGLQNVE